MFKIRFCVLFVRLSLHSLSYWQKYIGLVFWCEDWSSHLQFIIYFEGRECWLSCLFTIDCGLVFVAKFVGVSVHNVYSHLMYMKQFSLTWVSYALIFVLVILGEKGYFYIVRIDVSCIAFCPSFYLHFNFFTYFIYLKLPIQVILLGF